MAGRSGLSLANGALALAADIGIDLALIPRLGIIGAAVGWAVAIVLRNALPLVQVRRLLRISAASPGLWWAAGAALLCFGAVPLLLNLATAEAVAVALLPLPVAGYCALLWRQRNKTDLVIVGRALRPRHRPSVTLAK
jgi:O-antigen/teichoic acid export membrane protein